MTDRNLTWHGGAVTRADRERLLSQTAACLWFTGLSGSGKSTLSRAVEERLVARGALAYVLDGDNVRMGLNGDLGFSPEDRAENNRRVGEVARLFVDAGLLVLAAFISPYRADRARLRERMDGRFVEVFVNPGLDVCEARDPKGLYKRARAGEIPEFTGISAPYEAPEAPELEVDTGSQDLATCAAQVVDWLDAQGYLPPHA